MLEGYGYNWTVWDKIVREKFKKQLEKLGRPKYRNFEVFKSPKGRWMAFHNDSYSDIKVIDLETLEIVTTNFYSNRVLNEKGEYDKEKSYYASHTNTSTFVPSYMKSSDDKYTYCIEPTDLNESDEEEWLTNFESIISLPFAFNSWTIWAADYELYVDILDLRDIDNGIIKCWGDKTKFTIPHGANHVRNYVNFVADFDVKEENKVGRVLVDFTILQERLRDRFVMTDDGSAFDFYDMYENSAGKEGKGKYAIKETLPWQDGQKRFEEWQVKRKEKNGICTS